MNQHSDLKIWIFQLQAKKVKVSFNSRFFIVHTDISVDYSKFEKPKARGSLNDYLMTGELNVALEYIHQAMSKAMGLDDNAFIAIHRLLAESQGIITSVVPRMEDEDRDNEGGDEGRDDAEW